MMEKSSEIVLSAEEKALIKGENKFTKTADQSSNPLVPERFRGWYSHAELEKIIDEQD